MRPVRQTLSASGPGPAIVLDYANQTNNFDVQIVAAGSTVNVEQTLADPWAPAGLAGATWVTAGTAVNGVLNITGSPTCVRANVTAYVAPVSVAVVPNSNII